jgi:hypothetical protein
MARIRARLALAAIAAVATLSGCAMLGTPRVTPDNVEWIEFSQTGSEWAFDMAEDAPEVEAFRQALRDHDVDPLAYEPAADRECRDAIVTSILIFYRPVAFLPGAQTDMTIEDCGAAAGSFEAEATAIFSGWRIANDPDGTGAALPNEDITAVVFVATGVAGVADGEHRQDNPVEVARFVALIDWEGVTWSDTGWVEFVVGGSEPCEPLGLFEVTTEYTGTDIVAGPIQVAPCGADDGFGAEVSDLFAEWAAG